MYIGLHVKYLLFLSDFNKLEFSGQGFEKFSIIKFHENPSSGSRVVACGRTDRQTDRQTDMTKVIVSFRNFAYAPKTDAEMFDLICLDLFAWVRLPDCEPNN
jgi:hypothetical protein